MNLRTAFVVDPLKHPRRLDRHQCGPDARGPGARCRGVGPEARLLEAVTAGARHGPADRLAPSQARAAPTVERGRPVVHHLRPVPLAGRDGGGVHPYEPPLDESVHHRDVDLGPIDPARTAMINDPRGIRLQRAPVPLPHFGVSSRRAGDRRSDSIRSFLLEHRAAVLKPVDGWRGPGRAAAGSPRPEPGLVDRDGDRHRCSRPVIVQRFLREVTDGKSGCSWWMASPSARSTAIPAPALPHRQSERRGAVTARDREICAPAPPRCFGTGSGWPGST